MRDVSSRFRYTGTSAAVNTWDQQEDDRGPGGLFRLLGEGTSPPQHNQRWVPSFFPSSSSSSSFFSRYIPISRKTFLLSFFFSLSLFFAPFSLCTFHGVQVSRRFLIILSLPRSQFASFDGFIWKNIYFLRIYRFIDYWFLYFSSSYFNIDKSILK